MGASTGRNLYYAGKFERESDTDAIDRLALVNERDALIEELDTVTRKLRLISAELRAYKFLLRRKRAKEYGND